MNWLTDICHGGFNARALTLAGILFSSAAWSAQPEESYLGLGFGSSDFPQMYELGAAWPGVSGVQAEESSQAWKFFTGYQFSNWLAVETAWVDFGDARVETDLQEGGTAALKLYSAGFEFSALATWSVTAEVQVFARAGVLAWKSQPQLDLSEGLPIADFTTPDKKGYAPVLGLGGQWDFNPRTSLRLDWSTYIDLADGDPQTWLLYIIRRY